MNLKNELKEFLLNIYLFYLAYKALVNHNVWIIDQVRLKASPGQSRLRFDCIHLEKYSPKHGTEMLQPDNKPVIRCYKYETS